MNSCRVYRLKETHAFFLDVQKAYNRVGHNSLWLKLFEFGVCKREVEGYKKDV